MKGLLLIVSAAACLAGCGNSDASAVIPGNPSGKPIDTREQGSLDARKQAGTQVNQRMAAAAQAMAAAKAKAGVGGQ